MKNLLSILAIIFIANQLSFAQLTATITNVTNETCNGMCDGLATVTATGGVTPYSYLWDSSTGSQTNETVTNLCSGVYNVTVTDASLDTSLVSVTITGNPPLQISVMSQTNVTCFGDCSGNASLFISGGTGSPYSIVWANGMNGLTGTNLCAGVYGVTVTDASACFATNSITITEPSPIVISSTITNSTCAQWNGAIDLSVTGGCGVYTYQWSNSSVNQDLTGLIAGQYCVTVTDGCGCTNSICANINADSGPIASICSQNNVSCFGGNDGSATVCASGGVLPYTYLWSNGNTTSTGQQFQAGVYVVTVTDSTGCSSMAGATITEPSALQNPINNQIINVSCNGGNDGSASYFALGGTPPYSYLWSNGNTTQTATNLSAGSYCVTVTDSNGCNSDTCGIVGEPAQLTVTTTSTNESCEFICDGQASAVVSGGTPPYSYFWDGGSMTPLITGLCSGNYWFTVADNNGCAITAGTAIYSSEGIEYSNIITDATCNEANGTASINIIGGIPPFSISFLSDTSQQISSTLTNLSAGAYFVQISDSIGCSKIDTILINNIGASEINIVSLLNVRCNGTSTGSVSISASGGISPYTISWSHGLLNSLTADTLFAGNYIVTVADSVGCVAVQNIGITQPGTLFLYITKTDANCGSYGTATAHPFGGTQPYWYMWSDGEIGQTAQINPSYTSIVTVTDLNDCQTTGTVLVNQYCWNLIKGKVFIDNNDDCIMDSSEAGLNNITLKLMPGYQYAYTNSQGEYSFLADSGSYTISVVSNVSPYYSLNCPANPTTISVTLNQMGDTLDGNNFAFVYDSTKIDLQTYLSSDIARPGFNYHYYINYRYFGHDTINATLTLTYDSILTYTNSSPAESYSSYPEIKWDLTLAPNAHGYVYANFVVPTIQNGGYLGRVLHSTAKIEPFTNDLDTLNNVSAYNRTIVGSYDPNEKEVFPVGYGALGAILPTDSVLTYTIHFQNTGTDTAFTVVVVDTLSSYVEPATVVSGASSHAYEFDMSGQGILKWTFNQILLVDSTTNEPASHGFITYTVKQKANNPHAALIENKAEIFFDFNPNITTNTATNKVDYYLSIKINESSQSSDKIEIYPNPFNENASISVISNNGNRYEKMEIYNITGSKVKTYTPIAQSKNFEIQKGDLKSGIYFIKIIGKNGSMLSGKMIVY